MKVKVYNEETNYDKKLRVSYDNEKIIINTLFGDNYKYMIQDRTSLNNIDLNETKTLHLSSVITRLVNAELRNTINQYKRLINKSTDENSKLNHIDNNKEIRIDINITNNLCVNTYSVENSFMHMNMIDNNQKLPEFIVQTYIFDRESKKKTYERYFIYQFNEIFDMFFTLHKIVYFNGTTRKPKKGVINENTKDAIENK